MINSDNLVERLSILLEAKMITPDIHDKVLKVSDFVISTTPTAKQEQMEIFVTHLSTALFRIKNGDDDFPLDENIVEELKSHSYFGEVEKNVVEIETIIETILPQGERNLITMHLLNMRGR